MSIREKDDPGFYAKVQERNLLRQYEHLAVRRALPGRSHLRRKSLPAAFQGCAESDGPVLLAHPRELEIVHHPIILPAYALWRLNWIHPFVEGNGRTARAACYYLLCVRHGQLLPGRKIVPERIRENRKAYYAALQAADVAWERGHFDVGQLADYLSELLKAQLSEP